MNRFYVGLHQPSDARHFDHAFISVNRLKTRKSDFTVNGWVMDSGAFTEISRHGHYRDDVSVYAAHVRRWADVGEMHAAVAQDWMCETHILRITGHDIPTHQRYTVERYDALLEQELGGAYILPVLQGYDPTDYVRHLDLYGDRITDRQWVGVGSVCKRQGRPELISAVLDAILGARPGLRLHGFGVKKTSLQHPDIRARLHTADSMAWSFAARYDGRNANDWREAKTYELAITGGQP